MTDFKGNFSTTQVLFDLGDLGKVIYHFNKPTNFPDEAIFLIMQQHLLSGVSLGNVDGLDAATGFIELDVPENMIETDFFYFLTKRLISDGYELSVDYNMKISNESLAVFENYWQEIEPLLRVLGLKIQKRPRRVKARHRYSKELADIPFTVDYLGSQATVYWQKRSELVVKKGATLLENAPLTKAGVIGFAGRFGLRLRQEHADAIDGNTLIKDVTLQSVNEVGTFLYFAGTNSWLQLKSPEGKTLHELTVVK
jgi:hypothetical protein